MYDTSLDLDSNGASHIGYYTLDPDAYKYATNASGSWVITTVALDAGEYCRLKVDASDHVHTVFSGAWESYYGYFDGATWNVETLEPITGSVDGHFSLCISDDETPHISFLNGTDVNLGYGYRTTNGWQFDMNIDTQNDNHLRLASWNGTQWEIEIFDPGPPWGGTFSSLKIDSNDFAHIACYGKNKFLYYFEAEDGWHVSNGLPCGLENISLNLDATDSPIICYYDNLTRDYKEARYAGPTPTPTVTNTPTPFYTNTPTPTATDPGGCNETGVEIIMPSQLFKANDPCWCHAVVCNANDYDLEHYPLFVILDVYGSLYWAPSFNTIYDNYLELHPKFSPGETVITILPEFPWPGGTGTAYGLFWYGALTDPEITDIYGIFGMCEFGWETD